MVLKIQTKKIQWNKKEEKKLWKNYSKDFQAINKKSKKVVKKLKKKASKTYKIIIF